MHSSGTRTEAGFTLIELLSVMATLSVLVAISVSTYSEYRKQAFHTVAKETLTFARTALEAGKADTDSFGNNTMWAYANKSSSFVGNEASTIAPGLKADNDMYIYVYHDPSCAPNTMCLEDYITIRHCKTQLRTLWYRYTNGLEYKWEKLSSTAGC